MVGNPANIALGDILCCETSSRTQPKQNNMKKLKKNQFAQRSETEESSELDDSCDFILFYPRMVVSEVSGSDYDPCRILMVPEKFRFVDAMTSI